MSRIRVVQEGAYARFRGTFTCPEDLAAFRRAIDGARYMREARGRLAPLDKVPAILRRLREAGLDAPMDEGLRRAIRRMSTQEWLDRRGVRERIDNIDEEIKALTGETLFSFQKTGAEWLATRHGALLADDMGLGKTRQAIVAIPSGAPILVICNSAAKGVWAGEMAKCRPLVRVRVLQGRDSFRWPRTGEMVVTNYDVLPEVHDASGKNGKRRCYGKLPPEPCRGCREELVVGAPPPRGGAPKEVVSIETRMGHKPDCKGFKQPESCPGCHPLLQEALEQTVMIMDEAHYIKNGTSNRTQRCRALAHGVREKEGRTWLLTGTPMENEPKELWSVFQAAGIAHEAFGDWRTFVKLFKGKAGLWGYTWGTPDDEIPEIVGRSRRVMMRRLKTEVLPDLPTKMYQDVLVEIDKAALAQCDAYLKKSGGIDRICELIEQEKMDFATMSSVRAALASAKIPAMLEIVRDHEEQGEPLLVFSAHRAPIDLLGRLNGWGVITGDQNDVKKREVAEKFQRGELKGLGLTIRAGGTALTLTRASRELFVDRDWKPTANAQAEDRANRIGSTRGLIVMTLKADHPLDRRVSELLLKKQRLISASVDSASMKDDAPMTEAEKQFELEMKRIQKNIEDEMRSGNPERGMPQSEAQRLVVEQLHTLSFESRQDERLAMTLAEEALSIGLLDTQWELAFRIAERGRLPPEETNGEVQI